MREIEPDTSQKNLVLEDPSLQTLKALAYRNMNSKSNWSADFIKNKGEGTIVLLHGMSEAIVWNYR
jgi:hypothetical protein